MSCKVSVPFAGSSGSSSTDNSFIACVTTGNRVSIRATDTLEVTNIFQCVDQIDKLEISPDNKYILCALYSRNVVQVFSLEDKDWKCRINEGVAGIINAYWTPDSRNVVTESDFGIQLSLWSLTEGNSVIVSLPKPPQPHFSKTSAFSDCGRFMAVVHRIDLQDQIGVYTVASQTSLGMSEVSKFRARSSDVASVHWVPGGTHIVTLDSPLTYKFCAYTPMGEYEAYQNALGLRCLGLPRQQQQGGGAGAEGKLLALGSFDGKVRLVSAYSWQLAFVLPLVHPRDLEAGFGGAGLLLTVEGATGSMQSTLFGGADEEGGAAEGDGATATEGDAAAQPEGSGPRQRQVPVTQQAMRCRALTPSRRLPSSAGAALGSEAAEPEQQEGEEEENVYLSDAARQHSQPSQSSTFFALRSLKTLPRAQTYVTDPKRVHTSTATNKTLKKGSSVAGGGGTASASVAPAVSAGSTGFPAMGVSWVGWSSTCSLLAAREEGHPRCVWVWRPLSARLVALLVLLEPVTCAKWRPTVTTAAAEGPEGAEAATVSAATGMKGEGSGEEERDVLALCTGSDKVYFWTAAAGVVYADVSTLAGQGGAWAERGHGGHQQHHHHHQQQQQQQHFAVTSLHWTRDGRRLVLRGKEAHCLCEVSVPATVWKTAIAAAVH